MAKYRNDNPHDVELGDCNNPECPVNTASLFANSGLCPMCNEPLVSDGA